MDQEELVAKTDSEAIMTVHKIEEIHKKSPSQFEEAQEKDFENENSKINSPSLRENQDKNVEKPKI